MEVEMGRPPETPVPDEIDRLVRERLEKSVYSVPEVARLLNLSEREVRTMIRYGALDAWRVGKNVKISGASIDRFHAGGNIAPKAAS